MRQLRNVLMFAALVFGSAALPALAQSAPPPPPAPTAAPRHNDTTDALIRAAIGLAGDEIARERDRVASTAHGTVTYFKRYDLQVQTGPNSYRNIRLHQGTVIYPRGATPGNGANVDVSGRAQPDGTLDADSITVRQ